MGEVIRRDAAIEDIFQDVKTTHTNAIAKQEKWQSIATERLTPVIVLIDKTEQRQIETEKILLPLEAAVDAIDLKADRLLARRYDDIWNEVGRPQSDPALDILFPQGSSYYTEGPDEEQPDRMELLAELLESEVHPKLKKEVAASIAKEIRDSAADYREAIEKVRAPRARLRLIRQVRTAIARSAQDSLAKFKRLLKVEGFSEAEIHSVIPDRPRPVKATPKPKEA